MPRLGAHMSISGGLHKALELGHSIGCQAVQLFTRNSNRWKSKQRTTEELQLYRHTLAETGIHPVVAIAPLRVLSHSPRFALAAASESGAHGLLDAAKAMAMTVVDLLASPETVTRIKEEFKREKLSRKSNKQ